MLTREYYARHSGIISPDLLKESGVTIIGVGGIGSWTALSLAKLGFKNLHLIDDDTIENENIASQFFTEKDVGEYKAKALAEYLERTFPDLEVTYELSKAQSSSIYYPIVVSGVDSIEARINIWDILELDENVLYYIDGRMGGEAMRLFAMGMMDDNAITKYEEKLKRRNPVADIPCSEKSIVYNTQVNGGIISSLVKKCVRGEEIPFEINFDLASYHMMTTWLDKE